jgi:hypothetical protein
MLAHLPVGEQEQQSDEMIDLRQKIALPHQPFASHLLQVELGRS